MQLTFWLVVLTILSGLIWLTDRFYWQKKRRQARTHVGFDMLKRQMLVDYVRFFFPVLLIVLVIRSFIVEPFRIPSRSMEPTLLVGDFLLVNKFKYGIKWPLTDTLLMRFAAPKRGDVIVFRWPVNSSVAFIKRIVAVPGDTVGYLNKHLYINGKLMAKVAEGKVEQGQQRYQENVLEGKVKVKHRYLIYNDLGQHLSLFNFKGLIVPPDEYFVMGDNRDNSQDSRYWGFVLRDNIIGQAFLTWMSWNSQHSRIRLERLGQLIS
ncbi:Signal peptidase I [Piscirickettsia salmonis]|uniref:signal peptidase I n=1 Tax=Piscirickettsia salmonis TaxID=1238 RepID=UPI0012B818EC|nr:signal peptidase I [Piscirickettsia salmonis]QGP49886.1 Signal peptidase I [Piscirickettsia salmonis]